MLKFTPLEFETDKNHRHHFLGETVKIYSVGVWNEFLKTPEAPKPDVKIYSVGVWNSMEYILKKDVVKG